MSNPWNEPLPDTELARFSELQDIQVVFDIGARTSLDYLDIKPEAQYHLFEPYPPFYQWLQEATKDMKNVRVNPYGLGDKFEFGMYNSGSQGFHGWQVGITEVFLPIKTLDWYIAENKIKRVDFLKIDAEKYDCKVLQGGKSAIGLARYIQYETWEEPQNKIMHNLLKEQYDCVDIGGRNMLCTLKKKS